MEFIVEYAVEDEVCDGLMTLYDEVAATGKANIAPTGPIVYAPNKVAKIAIPG